MKQRKLDDEIIDFVKQNPGCSSNEIRSNLHKEINPSTFARHIKSLIVAGYLRKQGAARATRYFYDDLLTYLSSIPESRQPVFYNFDFLKKYDPVNTPFFSTVEKEKLFNVGRLSDGKGKLDTKVQGLYEKFIIDLSYASSKLEGNTYDYLDTDVLIRYGQEAEGKNHQDAIMILNHKAAIKYMFDNLSDIDTDRKTTKDVHVLLSHDLPNIQPNEEGSYRHRAVTISHSAYVPLDISYQIEEEMAFLFDKLILIDDPFEKSLFILAMISYIQPFIDVNKRTGRLMCNVPLMKNDLCPFSFTQMNKKSYINGILAFYELNRIDILKHAFIDAYIASAPSLKRSMQSIHPINPLVVKYRNEIKQVVKDIVLSESQVSLEDAIDSKFDLLESKEKEEIIKLITEKLENIGPNQLVIYGLTEKEHDNYVNNKWVGGLKV